MNDDRDRDFEGFERRARDAFEASVEALDAGARSRLNQARQRALAVADRGRSSPGRWWTWGPVGALAASVLAAALLFRGPADRGPEPIPTASTPAALSQEPLEMLAAGDEFEIATAGEDLEFYEWVELATADAANGAGRS